MTRVLVTGATGNIGSKVVAELRDSGVLVRAFARDPDRAVVVLGGDVEIAAGDFAEPDSIRRALPGVDGVFLMCGNDPRQVEYETNVIDAAAAEHVGRIVMLSTVGAKVGAPAVFADQHGRIEEHLRACGVPAVILQSSYLMSNILGSAGTIARTGKFFLPAGEAHVAMIDPRDVAAAAAAVLTAGGHDGQTCLITGPAAITHTEVAEHLSAALGRAIEYVDVPDDAALAGLAQGGVPAWLAEQIVAVFQSLRAGVNSRTTDTFRELTGREARGFADFARDIATPFLTG
ncbi:SDR family oxidoreductase [Kitasatospora sp. KL5]|uniref:SDR family oxidoreductase n=1 Tax=Kitasatospora sp. KL5 TaxID=3425125 RepID=UPI003D6F5325